MVGDECVIQLAAGSQHVVALTRLGNVFTWGGNRKGQLGDGQQTSSAVPRIISQLQHRPITEISCGEAHTMARTITGNVYVWGDNR